MTNPLHLIDDGTLDTVFYCPNCDLCERYSERVTLKEAQDDHECEEQLTTKPNAINQLKVNQANGFDDDSE